MRAVDTNVLVYAHNTTSAYHDMAVGVLTELAEGSSVWAVPWPCVYEFFRTVTHDRAEAHRSVEEALDALDLLFEAPTLILLSETERHHEVLRALLARSPVRGNLVHDAHIAALCVEHGVDEILTADNDFRRFDAPRVVDPFR